MTGRERRVVYVTYDGLEDPLGQSQVLPYLRGLAKRGHSFHVISFEKPVHALRRNVQLEPGIRWTALRYHKGTLATFYDMASGAIATAIRGALDGADLIHVRAYVPGAIALPWVVGSGTPLLFDTRSLWADEKVDVGAWPRDGSLHQSAKAVERELYARADAITTLTHAVQRYLREEYPHKDLVHAPIHVIPTCTELDFFTPDAQRNERVTERLRGANALAYVGSLGGWYMDRDMARFYLAFRKHMSPARFLVISKYPVDEVRGVLAQAGVADELVHVPARRDEVPGLIRCAKAAVCFVRPLFSKRASAPTKLGEILGCGVPVAANVVGDMATVLTDTPAGVVVEDMSAPTLDAAARALAEAAGRPRALQDARALAERWFRLDDGLDAYDRLYRAMPRRHGEPVTGDSARDQIWPPVRHQAHEPQATSFAGAAAQGLRVS